MPPGTTTRPPRAGQNRRKRAARRGRRRACSPAMLSIGEPSDNQPAVPSIADAADLTRSGRSQRSPDAPPHRPRPAGGPGGRARRRFDDGADLRVARVRSSRRQPTVATPTSRSVTSSPSGLPLSASDQVVHDNLTLRSTLTALGPDLAGLVTDAETGEILWSHTPLEHQLPASNAKLVTAVNALSTFGPAYQITTKVVQGTHPAAARPRRPWRPVPVRRSADRPGEGRDAGSPGARSAHGARAGRRLAVPGAVDRLRLEVQLCP